MAKQSLLIHRICLLHELFHLNSLSRPVSSYGHVIDIGIYYQSGFDPDTKWYQAYRPTRTRVLVLWLDEAVGQSMATNGKTMLV